MAIDSNRSEHLRDLDGHSALEERIHAAPTASSTATSGPDPFTTGNP